jgi:hypothetical protein
MAYRKVNNLDARSLKTEFVQQGLSLLKYSHTFRTEKVAAELAQLTPFGKTARLSGH